jgi:hypothetical protein
MSKKLTPWFPNAMKPAHAGNYQLGRKKTGTLFFPYHYFDGKKWLHQADSRPSRPVTIDELDIAKFYGAEIMWRGLAKKP